jgi:hypothetical protein
MTNLGRSAAPADDVGLKYLSNQLKNPMTKNAGERGIALTIDDEGSFYMTGILQQSGRFGDTILECTGTTSPAYRCRDLFVAKYDRQRKLVWLKHAQNASGSAIATHGTNSIIVGGAIWGDTSIAEKKFPHLVKPNAFFARYDRNGQASWVQLLSSTGACQIYGVATEPNGNIFVTGEFSGLTDFGGSTLLPRGQRDGFLAKYTEDGKLVWARQHGDDISKPGNVAVDRQGNAYVVGTFWDSSFGSQKVYLMNSSVGFKTRVYLIKYAPDGTVLWATNAGSDIEPTHRRYPEGLNGQNVAIDREGNPYITGVFHNTRQFGSITITNEIIIRRYPRISYTNENKSTLFFAKYTPTGALEWVRQRREGDGKFEGAVSLASATMLNSNSRETIPAKVSDADGLVSAAAKAAASVRGTTMIVAEEPAKAASLNPLRIFKAANNVVLAWPATAKDLVLESTDALMPFPVWTTVWTPRQEESSFVTVILPARDAARFYRLRAP